MKRKTDGQQLHQNEQ